MNLFENNDPINKWKYSVNEMIKTIINDRRIRHKQILMSGKVKTKLYHNLLDGLILLYFNNHISNSQFMYFANKLLRFYQYNNYEDVSNIIYKKNQK